MSWCVYDPQPELAEEGPGPVVYGPFDTEQAAVEYANVMHPDDMSGDAVVLPLTAPDL